MSSDARKYSRRNVAGLRVEPLEPRALLSYAGVLALAEIRSTQSAFASLLASDTSGSTSSSSTPQPTPTELRRQRYVAKLIGSYHTGYGQFTDQAFQVSIIASGGSNQAFHSNINLLFFFPKDTTQPVTGVALISAPSVTTTGSALGFTLQADAQQPGYHGLPTQFTWTVNDSNSSGAYSGATGQGTLTIRYYPSGKGPLHGFGAGTAALDFQGLVYTSGVNNILATPGNLH